MSNEAMREAFEAAMRKACPLLPLQWCAERGEYESLHTDSAWLGWRSALNEAARICDIVANNQRSDWQNRVDGPKACAAAIRRMGGE